MFCYLSFPFSFLPIMKSFWFRKVLFQFVLIHSLSSYFHVFLSPFLQNFIQNLEFLPLSPVSRILGAVLFFLLTKGSLKKEGNETGQNKMFAPPEKKEEGYAATTKVDPPISITDVFDPVIS